MAARDPQTRRTRQRRPGLFRRWFGSRALGLVRVGVYLTIVSLVLGLIAGRSAMGSMSEQALIVGRQLSKLEDLTESTNRLLLNGQSLYLASAVTTEPVDRVLDRFEGVCRDDGVLPHQLAQLDEVLRKKVPEPKSAFDLGILRTKGQFDGAVACVVNEDAKSSLFDALPKFADSLDLKELGALRYVYARQTEGGRTHVITIWTDGSFKLGAMVPEVDGADTPGTDSPGAIRPPESQRLLTASAAGAPHAVRVYDSKATPEAVLAAYEREMPKLGWERISVADADVPESRYFTKGGVDLLVVADENGERTAVSVIETRSR